MRTFRSSHHNDVWGVSCRCLLPRSQWSQLKYLLLPKLLSGKIERFWPTNSHVDVHRLVKTSLLSLHCTDQLDISSEPVEAFADGAEFKQLAQGQVAESNEGGPVFLHEQL